jgi:hypothetical protein
VIRIEEEKERIMSGFNRRGPMEEGPRTGAARGLCNARGRDRESAFSGVDFETGRTSSDGGGRGARRQRRRGERGLGRGWNRADPWLRTRPLGTREQALQRQLRILEGEIEEARRRLAEMNVEVEE